MSLISGGALKSGEADWGSVGYAWPGVFSVSLCSCLYGLGHGQIVSRGSTVAGGGVEGTATCLVMAISLFADDRSIIVEIKGS